MTYEFQDKNIELTRILRFHAKWGSLVRKPRHQLTQLQIFLHKYLEDNFLGILEIFLNFSRYTRAHTRHPEKSHAPARKGQRVRRTCVVFSGEPFAGRRSEIFPDLTSMKLFSSRSQCHHYWPERSTEGASTGALKARPDRPPDFLAKLRTASKQAPNLTKCSRILFLDSRIKSPLTNLPKTSKIAANFNVNF